MSLGRSLDDKKIKRIYITLPKLFHLLPYGFMWTPFCPDLNQTIFEPGYTLPKLRLIWFHMASFGHISIQIWIKPRSNPGTPSQSYGRFASKWLHLDTFPSGSGSIHRGSPPSSSDVRFPHFCLYQMSVPSTRHARLEASKAEQRHRQRVQDIRASR